MYKLTLELSSPICFIDPPLFDGIMAYCYIKDKLGYMPRSANITEDELIPIEIPIKKHEEGYYMASYMLYDKSKAVNFTGSWKKRWANQHDHLADFGKSKRQVEISTGSFKSYDMPLNLWSIPEVWFYFDSDNIKEVERLFSTHMYGLGKKTSQGNGEIASIKFDVIDYNPFDKIIRPIPIKSFKNKNIPAKEMMEILDQNNLVRMPLTPPYSCIIESRMENCLVPC